MEIAWQCRPFTGIDRVDAALTLDALARVERESRQRGETVSTIDKVWQAKAAAVRRFVEENQ